MAATDVVLKLTLDALGAKEEASGLVKAVDSFTQGFQKMGAEMENTMRGRLIKGVLGTFKDNFSTMMNDELPQVVKDAKLADALAVSVSEGLVRGSRDYAKMFVEQIPDLNLQNAQGTLALLNAMTMGGQMPMDPTQAKAMLPYAMDLATAQNTAARTQRETFDTALEEYYQEPSHEHRRPTPVSAAKGLEAASKTLETAGGAGWSMLPADLREWINKMKGEK